MVSVISFLLIFRRTLLNFNMRLKACVLPLLLAYQQLFCILHSSSIVLPYTHVMSQNSIVIGKKIAI